MKPLLKWAGGKRHIADLLESFFPRDWRKGTYYEPFLGGAALFLHLQPTKAQLSDINSNLVNFYLAVRDDVSALLLQIREISNHFDSLSEEQKKSFFYELRSKFNSDQFVDERPAILYCLNKLCFNGLYRENSKGDFNVPFGNKKKFPSFIDQDFVAVSASLRSTTICISDFEKAVIDAKEGDFVYFDPPYIPLDATSSFTAYSSDGFGLAEQQRLAVLMKELSKRGVRAVLSNSSSPVTVQIYDGLQQHRIDAPRMVSAKGSSRGMVEELVITNY